MIVAGIVLFNPDVQRLKENISSILSQVNKIILFNNGSAISEEIREICKDCIYIDNKENVGIATALNEICRYADESLKADWVLTLDQDSICPQNLIEEYSKYLELPDVGMLAPIINDINVGIMPYDAGGASEYEAINACITSASLLNISAWKNVGGFWNELFIDLVDFDICWSLNEHGYNIYRIFSVTLTHEIGHSRQIHLFGKKEVAYNHPPIRNYYIARNNILVGRKHGKTIQCVRWGLKRFLIIARFEDNKLIKMSYMLKGLIHGIVGKSGKWQKSRS